MTGIVTGTEGAGVVVVVRAGTTSGERGINQNAATIAMAIAINSGRSIELDRSGVRDKSPVVLWDRSPVLLLRSVSMIISFKLFRRKR